MRRGAKDLVKSVAVWATLFGLAAPGPAAAEQAETESSHRSERWIPSLAFVGGASILKQQASQSSICFLGGPEDEVQGFASCNFLVSRGIAPLRPPQSGKDVIVTPFVGANLQLMSPTLEPIPGRPRFFVNGELNFNFGSKHSIAIEGDPTGVRLPDTISDPSTTATKLLNGVGSRTDSEYERLAYGAGIGIAFPFELWGRKLWVKPSAVWTRFEIQVDGLTIAGLKDDPATQSVFRGTQIREIILSGSDTLKLDGVGPAIELELETGQFGPVGATVFVNFNAYRILGNREVEIRDGQFAAALPPVSPPGNPNGLPADLYGGVWNFSTKPWSFRTAVGMRIEWIGY